MVSAVGGLWVQWVVSFRGVVWVWWVVSEVKLVGVVDGGGG